MPGDPITANMPSSTGPKESASLADLVKVLRLRLPMIALIIFTNRADIMGPFRNSRPTRIAAVVGTVAVLALNAVLIAQTLGVPIPGLSGAE